MADKIIIEVGLDNGEYAKKAEETIKKIQELKVQQAILTDTGKKNTLEFEQNRLKLQQLQRELKANTLLSQEYDDSIIGLQANLSILTAQWSRLSKEQRENTDEGKALAAQMLDVTNKLKEQEGGVGNFRRNVGNYKSALEDLKTTLASQILEYNKLTDAEKKNSEAGKELQQQIEETRSKMQETSNELARYEAANREASAAADEFASYTEVSSEVNSGFGQSIKEGIAGLVPFGSHLLQIATGARTMAGGVLTGASATKILNAALASTAIGLFVVVLASLINYLSKFKPLTDAIEKGVSALSAGFEALGNAVFQLIKPLEEVFTNPKKALKDFGDFLLNNIINRFKAFGVIIDAIKNGNLKQLTNGLVQAGTGIANVTDKVEKFGKGVRDITSSITNAARAAADLTQRTQDLEDAERESISTLSKLRLERDKYAVQSKNTALSEAERIKLLQLSSDKEKQAADLEVSLAKQRLKLIQDEIALDLKRNGGREISDELQDKLANQQAKVNDLQAASLKFTEKRYNDEQALRDKAQSAREKEAEKYNESEQERIASLVRTNQTILTERQKELDSINAEFKEKIAKFKKYKQATEQLEKEWAARLAELRDSFQKEDLAAIEENNKQIQDLQVASIKDAGKREYAQLQLNNDRRLADQDKIINELKDRQAKGEKGLTDIISSEEKLRIAIFEENARILLEKQGEIDAEKLKKAQESQQALAQAAVDNAGTDADKLVALQTQLDLEYQIRIANAIKLNEDTTAIHEQFKAKQKELDDQTNQAAIDGINQFGNSFQQVVGENTKAAKVAADIQAKINAAQILQNNIRIIQENLLALTSQGKLPFPANLIAIASTLTALTSAVAAAKKLAPGFQDGGVFESDGKGAVLPGYSRTDNTNAMLRSGEAVIVAEAVRDPKALGMLSAINQAYGGRPLVGPGSSGYKSSYPAFAGGGVYSAGSITQNIVNAQEIAAAVSQEISKLTIVTDVREIISATEKRGAAINSGVV